MILLVVICTTLAAISDSSNGRPLDPGSADPDGTMALARLVQAHGVAVTSTNDLAEAVNESDPADVTIVLTHPQRAPGQALDGLAHLAGQGADVVLLEPGATVVDALDLPVTVTGRVPSGTPAPRCQLPEATAAGTVTLGGRSGFRAAGPDAAEVTTCYPVGSASALVVVPAPRTPGRPPAPSGPGRFVLVGNAGFMTNDRLDEQGNAALAIGLLNRHRTLSWVTPQLGAPDAVARRSLLDLLPDRVPLACLQLGLAMVVLALWRGRRLGPPVPEPLPVVVRAAETVEGRGRLYAAAQARDLAAAVLRATARGRLTERLGLPTRARPARPGDAGQPEADPTALVASVAARTGRSPMEITLLLYGSGMSQDAPAAVRTAPTAEVTDEALVALVDQLDALDRQVAAGSDRQVAAG
ncbi:hypothetical protein BL254_11640 [Protofrankia sp. BMG5.30]|nr:hypothetical protein BL254_11640 [Protofrankia sp. BMG5.30]